MALLLSAYAVSFAAQSPHAVASAPVGRAPVVEMGSKRTKPRPSGGGFGAPPPPPLTLEDVCSSFKTRLPADATTETCPCGDGRSYADCCQPYHLFNNLPESLTPEWCLRSRYVAFAYRLPSYIIATTDTTNRDYRSDKIKWARFIDKEQMFDSFRFDGLEVGETEAGSSDKEAFLELGVTLTPIDKKTKLPTEAAPMVFSERSKFKQAKSGAWLYAAGDVTTEAAGLRGRSLNSEKDVEALRKDVDTVSRVMKDPRVEAKIRKEAEKEAAAAAAANEE